MKKLSLDFGKHLELTRNHINQKLMDDEKTESSLETSILLEDEVFQKEGFNFCQIIGNFNRSFIVCSFNSNIYLIDQHAASEKSLYVRFLKERNLFPQPYNGNVFEIENVLTDLLKNESELLKQLGWRYEIIHEGPIFTQVCLTETPSLMSHQCKQNDFLEVLQSYYENQMLDLSRSQKSSLASTACHNAYRIGDNLQPEQMRQLVDSLYEMSGSYNCPHSRPILVLLGSVDKLKNNIFQDRKYTLD